MRIDNPLRTGSRCAPILLFALLVAPFSLLAQSGRCTRYTAGSTIQEPENLFSTNGKLAVNLTYYTEIDSSGNTLYCLIADNGSQSPTFHVHPGDDLVIQLKNGVPASASSNSMSAMPGMIVSTSAANLCGPSSVMNATSVNLHYHGANVAPSCHQDDVLRTVINAGQSYRYNVHFPANEPPGLYWYHPHIHGMAEGAVLGGASGAIIVEGIENVNPIVAGLPTRTLIIRDNLVPGHPGDDSDAPSWDLSLNYTPVPFPAYTPVVIPVKPGQKQFWRVLSATADSIIKLQVKYDGVVQPLTVVALDGVPCGSQDGTGVGTAISRLSLMLPPASRAEFILTAPPITVKTASVETLSIDTGEDGDYDPLRPIATLLPSDAAPDPPLVIPQPSAAPVPGRFAGLASAAPTTKRHLYFSEVLSDPNDPDSPTNFFITVAGQTPVVFSPTNPPAIVTTQGSVEDWTIENRALENHVFHIHQIHFLVLEQNGKPVPNGQYLDTLQVPYWSGTGPYPSVKVRMDFRGPDVGDFVYHCHILGHEDSGMMAIIQVNPR